MTSLPFGFGGFESISDAPDTQTTKRPRQWQRDIGRAVGAFTNPVNRFQRGGAGIPTMMAFMGMPNFANRPAYGNGGGGGGFGFPGGGGNGGDKPPETGGEDPPYVDPNNPPGGGGANQTLLNLLYPPPIGTGAQWRNTMKYGA